MNKDNKLIFEKYMQLNEINSFNINPICKIITITDPKELAKYWDVSENEFEFSEYDAPVYTIDKTYDELRNAIIWFYEIEYKRSRVSDKQKQFFNDDVEKLFAFFSNLMKCILDIFEKNIESGMEEGEYDDDYLNISFVYDKGNGEENWPDEIQRKILYIDSCIHRFHVDTRLILRYIRYPKTYNGMNTDRDFEQLLNSLDNNPPGTSQQFTRKWDNELYKDFGIPRTINY